jgi:hypothetical protein
MPDGFSKGAKYDKLRTDLILGTVDRDGEPVSFLPPSEKIVNVASVPHRSPFRYPGGKTWLVPRVRRWLLSPPKRPNEFIELFPTQPSASGPVPVFTPTTN